MWPELGRGEAHEQGDPRGQASALQAAALLASAPALVDVNAMLTKELPEATLRDPHAPEPFGARGRHSQGLTEVGVFL